MSLIEAWRVSGYAESAALAGRNRPLLARDAWLHALARNASPAEYFAYRLFETPDRGDRAWLRDREIPRLIPSLTGREAITLADDKLAFAGAMSEAGLAAVPTLAHFAGGGAVQPMPEDSWPQDLVIKPRWGANGRGIELWVWNGERHEREGETLGRDALAMRLATLGGTLDRIVQPRLLPHPAFAELGSPGITGLRLVTGRWPDGRVVITHGWFSRPGPNAFIWQDGSFGLVDLDRGRVEEAGPARRDPVFAQAAADRALSGLEISDWDAARSLVLAGHAVLPPPAPVIGWDVALTDRGPVLIEANVALDFYLYQLARAAPAGDALVPLLDSWLQCSG